MDQRGKIWKLTIFRQLRIITIHQTSAGETTLIRGQHDPVHGIEETGVVGGNKKDEGGNEDRRVEHGGALVALDETFHVLVVPLFHNLFIQTIAGLEPAGPVRAGEVALVGEPKAAIKCDPQQDFGVDKTLLVVADLPDAHVLLVLDGEDVVEHLADRTPEIPMNGLAILVVEVDGVHEFSVNVKLVVVGGAVADPDGPAAAVAV
jgi:hypothetical protein